METTLTSKGQLTLPKAIRIALNLKSGDKVIFEKNKDGTYTLRSKTSDVRILKGSLSYSGQKVTTEDMQKTIEESEP